MPTKHFVRQEVADYTALLLLTGEDNVLYELQDTGVTYKWNSVASQFTVVAADPDYYQYASGSAQPFFGAAKIYSTNAMFANVFEGYPIEVKTDVVVTESRFNIVTPAVGNFVFGLYSVVNGLPSTKLWQSTQFDTNIGGVNIYTHPSPVTITKGLYVMAFHTDINFTPRTALTAPSYAQSVEFIGLAPNLSFTDNFYVTWRGVLAYNSTMPTTWPVGSVPYVGNDGRIPIIVHIIQ
jgi:hypothetical protein